MPPATAGTRRALALIEAAYDSVVREPSPYAVLVTGAAGDGAVGLVEELAAQLERRGERPAFLVGCDEARAAEEPFGLLANVARRAVGTESSEEAAARRDALARRLARGPGATAEEVGAAWEAWLAAECAAGPVVLVLDGFRWANAASVEAVGGALRGLEGRALLVVAVNGEEVGEQVAGLWEGVGLAVVPMGG